MSKHIAFLSAAAAVLAAVLPAAAADYDGGYDGGDRPLAYHSRDDVYVDGGRAHVEHRQELRSAEGFRRGPGPVVFDERGPGYGEPGYGGPGFREPGFREPGYRRHVADERFGPGDDRPAGFVPRAERFDGGYGGFGGGYRPAAVAVGPAYGGFAGASVGDAAGGYGGPDEGCTMERARSITPGGWEKTVTHRTCYRR